MMDLYLNAFATLIVLIDPIGVAPIFLAVTTGMTTKQQREVAFRATIIGFGILFVFLLIGGAFLGLLGISLPAFRIAGGLLLFFTAFEMIFAKRAERQGETAEKAISESDVRDIAVFPLAIPMLSGPAAISAVVLLGGRANGVVDYSAISLILALCMGITLIAFLMAERLTKFLGETGRTLITRLLGVILAALAVQFVVDGIKQSFIG